MYKEITWNQDTLPIYTFTTVKLCLPYNQVYIKKVLPIRKNTNFPFGMVMEFFFSTIRMSSHKTFFIDQNIEVLDNVKGDTIRYTPFPFTFIFPTFI